MAITTVQEQTSQYQELTFFPIEQHTDFDEIKSFLDQIRNYHIPTIIGLNQKVVSLSSLRSDNIKSSNPRLSVI